MASAQSILKDYKKSTQSYINQAVAAQKANNAFNAEQAQIDRDFQERLSSTAHQREVADLLAAGLNPVLSINGGNGASTASGSTATADTSLSSVFGQLATGAVSAVQQLASTLASNKTSVKTSKIAAKASKKSANIAAKASRYGSRTSAKASKKTAKIAAKASRFGSRTAAAASRYGALLGFKGVKINARNAWRIAKLNNATAKANALLNSRTQQAVARANNRARVKVARLARSTGLKVADINYLAKKYGTDASLDMNEAKMKLLWRRFKHDKFWKDHDYNLETAKAVWSSALPWKNAGLAATVAGMNAYSSVNNTSRKGLKGGKKPKKRIVKTKAGWSYNAAALN